MENGNLGMDVYVFVKLVMKNLKIEISRRNNCKYTPVYLMCIKILPPLLSTSKKNFLASVL